MIGGVNSHRINEAVGEKQPQVNYASRSQTDNQKSLARSVGKTLARALTAVGQAVHTFVADPGVAGGHHLRALHAA